MSGQVVDNGAAPLAGVTISATGGHTETVFTDGSGNFTLTVPHGTTAITITPSLTGYAFAPVTRSVAGPVTGAVAGQDFVGTLIPTYVISGTVLDGDSNPVENVLITAYGGFSGSALTNASGFYSFTVYENTATVHLSPSLTGYFFTPTLRSVTGPITANAPAQDFTATDAVCFVDNFNRPDGPPGTSWTVSTSSGSFGPPVIVNNRLRLTDTTLENSSTATLNAVFPGFGNRIEVEFDHYSYGTAGTGGDGIAVVLSDADIPAFPGGFGGSLGYAQRDGTIDGFTGGWIGVGLDEYGNFSNPTEGRVGGPGFRAQALAVRGSGSGQTGYAYHQGTNTLVPGISSGTTEFATPHRYRIVIDHSNDVNSWVSVERDTGSGWEMLISPYDAKAEPGQAEVPDQWRLSFTGSTGASSNNHEIGNLRICATEQISTVSPDHYVISHPGTGITCLDTLVTVAAHDVDHKPVVADGATITLSTTTGRGNWTLVTAGSGVLNNGALGDGVATYTFPAFETSATFAFNYTDIPVGDSEAFFFAVTDGTLTSLAPGHGENPQMTFYRSGFRFINVTDGNEAIPVQIGGKPSDVGWNARALGLQAVRASDDDPLVCEAAFPDNTSVTIELGAECSDPSACAGSQVSVTNNATTTALPTNNDNGGMGTSAYTGVSLLFGPGAVAPLVLGYPDVGRLQLHARYDIPLADTNASGDFMFGSSLPIVWRPFALRVAATGNPAATGAGGPVYTTAGTAFTATVDAVLWQSADDLNNDGIADGHDDTDPANNANLADNAVAPNFSVPVTLGYHLVAPAAGAAPGLGGTPSVASFSRSSHVGRFRPHHFDMTATASCGVFNWSGQPFMASAVARNAGGAITLNFDGPTHGYAKNLTLSDAGDATGFTNNLVSADDFVAGSTGVVVNDVAYTFAVPETLPATLNIRGVDTDGTSSAGYLEDDIEIRSGRLRIGNANGPELMALVLPVEVQSWRDFSGVSGWGVESDDSCSTLAVGNITTGNYQGGLGSATITDVSLTNSAGSITIGATNAFGSVDVSADLTGAGLPWLQFDWAGDGLEDPVGRASFGLFDGNPRRIYIREIY
ncbi:MAG: carboxypeptidase-like regulatory domain-containing protein [Xanthomonadaceae bacterium]|nr:carboxypeptidase-like regulatory domain-containing protein [Xanthomonadaceae bacterium]